MNRCQPLGYLRVKPALVFVTVVSCFGPEGDFAGAGESAANIALVPKKTPITNAITPIAIPPRIKIGFLTGMSSLYAKARSPFALELAR